MTFDVGEIHAGATDFLDPRITGIRRVRLASLARAKTGVACRIRRVEEPHAIAPRPAAPARRPAIHSGRFHPIDESGVGSTLARPDSLPAGVVHLCQPDV